MLCPKCKTDNPDNAGVCSSCGTLLQADTVKRTSRLAVTAFALSLCGIIIPPLFAVPALITAMWSVFHIRKRTGRLKGQKFALAAIACSLFGLLILAIWNIDAPPIADDYTMADLHSAPPNCNPSYEILMKLANEPNSHKDYSAIGLSKQDIEQCWQIYWSLEPKDHRKNPVEEADRIAREHKAETDLWNKTKSARDIIDELNEFDQIADLSQPYPNDDKRRFCFNLVDMAHLYMFHAYMQVNEANEIDAAKELVKFDSVVRKLAPNVRSILNFMACFMCLKSDVTAANYIANNPRTSRQAVEILAELYCRNPNEEISVRNPILGEYLLLRKPHIIELRNAKGGEIIKPNSLLRLTSNICTHWIALAEPSANKKLQLKVWPSFYPDMPSINYQTDEVSFWYKLYNPLGSVVMEMMKFKNRLIQIKAEIEARDGLIRIVLNKRLGSQVDLKSPVYGGKYIIDKDKRTIFSPSSSEIGYDIALPYDPNVIKF